jgi:hypothetical protein
VGIWETTSSGELISFAQGLVDTYLPDETAPSSEGGAGGEDLKTKWGSVDTGFSSYTMTQCGTVCGSDHISWNLTSYPAVYVAESSFEEMYGAQAFHSTLDAVDGSKTDWSWKHVGRFVRLGVAWVVEMGEA